MRTGLATLALALAGTTLLVPSRAGADVQHTIGKGHTIEAIANRYHVSAKAIIEANHLTDLKHLKIGDVLTIPKAESHDAKKDAKKDEAAKAKTAGKDREPEKKDAKPAEHTAGGTYAAKAKTPGVLHIKRLGSSEELDVKIADHGTHVSPSTLKTFEKLLRSSAGQNHPIEPRLIALLGVVSNHFGSRKIEVVSGFRPYTPTQYTPHSNHNHGKAIDFRVAGVPNEVVRDFCRTLKNVGCGYYPNSTFVHLDVRESAAFWIDYSRPGEPPRYNAPNVAADEGTSDVHPGERPSANTPPPPAPAEPAAPAAAETAKPAED
jgi:uncharacterized protein YcbK (DUF882 family)